MTHRLRYCLYLITFCLACTNSASAQFSEEDLEKQANDLFEAKKYSEAMPLYSQLLSLNPTKPEYNYRYGATALYGDADKKEEAIKFLRFASKQLDIDILCWYFLGRAYHLNYQFADAVSAYEAYMSKASSKDAFELHVEREIESARSGLNLLSNIKEVKVIDKKLTAYESFFRAYELGEIGGKILVTPDELLSSVDKKKNHKSLIHFRGSGTTVYFSSYGKDDKTGLDIYKAEVLPGGTFSEPVKVGGFINTEFDEDFPFMHPDNKTFYFSSTGHTSMGGYDIFRSAYDAGMDVFSQPENLDFAINTPDDELFYIADTAQKMANFASARSSKQGELHVYRVLVQSNPIELTFVKGTFINRVEASQKLAKVSVLDASTNKPLSEQYTNPDNGDYVVSVPRSGKFKFVVEVQGSDKVHAGLVDIPKSAGIQAYIQEMELVLSAGVEKLLINNKFDQTYDGDVLALAKDLLRKQAELDVNFDPATEPEPELPVEEDTQDFVLAYKAAGFPAGLSNESVLEQSKLRVRNLEREIDKNKEIKARAIEEYLARTTDANIKITEAKELSSRAESAEGAERSKLMFSAALVKSEANAMVVEAQNAFDLAMTVESINQDNEEVLQKARDHSKNLESTLETEDYESSVKLLSEELAIQNGQRDEISVQSAESVILANSLDSKKTADNMMQRPASMREQADEINSKLITKRRQREKAKGKSASEIDNEIASLEQELADLESSIETSFDRASKSLVDTGSKARQYELFEAYNNVETPLPEEERSTLLSTTLSESEISDYQDEIDSIKIDAGAVAAYAASNPEEFGSYDPKLRSELAVAYFAEEVPDNIESTETVVAEDPEITASISEDVDEELASNENDTPILDTDSSSQNDKVDSTVGVIAALPDTQNDENEAEEIPSDISYEEAQNLIEAEKIKVQAATDWLVVIDASIAELESGVGGDDEEEVQAQLDEYRNLRLQKESEIAASEKKMASLALVSPNSYEYTEVSERAEEDLNSLTSGQVASLESKTSIASSESEYVQDISKIDADYIPELTSIELSGKSSPEIATDRIALNKEFVVSLDKLIQEEGATEVDVDKLLELRRIKYLEIKQDEEIAQGALAYEPRTIEAQEYEDLLADTESSDATVNAGLSSLSPKMQEDLSTDYDRSQINSSYTTQRAALPESSNDSAVVAKRMELNKAFLRDLQSEIEFYSQTIKSQEGEVPVALSVRYNELLTDRSTLADEIQSDQEQLNNIAELTATETNPVQMPDAAAIALELESEFQEEIEEIQADEYTEAELLRAKAEVNFDQAARADSLVIDYMSKLDVATTDSERDQIQLVIQGLDAIAADKKQEADRLMYESDILASTATDTDVLPSETITPNTQSETTAFQPRDYSSSPSYADLRYRSLNANISYSKLEPRLDSVRTIRGELVELSNDYQSIEDETAKRELQNEILRKEVELSQIESSLVDEIALSNAAEIEYYKKSNAELIKNIEANFAEDADLAEYGERSAEISEMLSRNELQRVQAEISDSEHIANELALIGSLADLNKDMGVFLEENSDELASSEFGETDSLELSPYELLLRNPANHVPAEGSTYITPIFDQVSATLDPAEREILVDNNPQLAASTQFTNTVEESDQEDLLASATKIDTRGFNLLKSEPTKLGYVLSSVKADSLRQLETISAEIIEEKTKSSNEKFAEAARLRNMVIHEELESNRAIVRRRAQTLEEEAEKDLEMAAIAAENAEELRVKRIEEERQLAEYASNVSPSELNELNALLSNETYTVVPDMDTAVDETVVADSTTIEEKVTTTSGSSEYSSDEMELYNVAGTWLGVVEIIGEKTDFSDVNESLFVESDDSPYNESNPIPLDPEMPDGLVFQVQVGAFRNPIPQNLYKEFAPVMGQKLPNGITRYRAGIFRIYEEAKSTRDLIRTKGYSDAFVVVYVDGERLTGAQAQDILNQANTELASSVVNQTPEGSSGLAEAKPVQTASQSDNQEAQETQVSTDYYNDPTAAEAVQVEITSGLFYTVQVGVYSKPVKLDQLYDLTELNSELTGSGYIRYTTGRFSDLSDARSRKTAAIDKGVNDAFITAYYNGKRISVQEASEILQKEGAEILYNGDSNSEGSDNFSIDEPSQQDVSTDRIEYIVIMGMVEGDVPQELANLFLENEDWNIQRMEGPAGQEMYISPKFESIDEADQFLQLAKESGVESAIIGKMVNGSITEVNVQN